MPLQIEQYADRARGCRDRPSLSSVDLPERYASRTRSARGAPERDHPGVRGVARDRDDVVDLGSDGLIPFGCGVLVAQGCLRRRVAQAVHDLLGSSAGRCGERAGEVTQIVEVQLAKALRNSGSIPPR